MPIQLPVRRGEVDLADLCNGVADELRAANPGRELEVAAHGDCRGQWDAARMAQVVSNLVGNALGHGAATAPVELRLRDAGGAVILDVRNRGPAIPAAVADSIFEPFRQGAGGDCPEAELLRPRGLGLGLYIVRAIVRAHGGTVTVCSDAEATTFTVRLGRGARTVPESPSTASGCR